MPSLTAIRKGLQIIEATNPEHRWISAEHDVIYVPEVELSAEAEADLLKLGWHKDDEFECWAAFV